MRSGKLTVIGRLGAPRPGTNVQWLCRCDCGNESKVTTSKITRQVTKQCRRCSEISVGLRNRKPDAAFNKILHFYAMNAAARGYTWMLTRAHAKSLFESDCYYCGDPPSNHKDSSAGYLSYTYNGIDRVDNTRGYEPDNVVACCFKCNRAKTDLSVHDFFSMIQKIFARHLKQCT
jgi:hypothetical protein